MADYYMDREMESYDYDQRVEEIEAEWDSGYHETRDGVRMKISKMEQSHLQNTIKYFEEKYPGIDTRPLRKRLDKIIKSLK